jgi:glycosyltransferase involved in cell wall biosynthesis
MLAASAGLDVPLLLSVWGNDFTLHAPSTPLIAGFTRRALAAASALHADCERDVRLARRWGFAASSPSLVLPGNGGIRADVFSPAPSPANLPIVINPRGFRAYVRNDVFFESIPLVQRERPDARFVCASMAEEPRAAEMVKRLGVQAITHFLPPLPHESMAEQFRQAQILVSPATHDGTPNTLLEGMACGCLPVAGDLESIREWITDGQNGLLVNPADPSALADAILRGLNDPLLRAQAARQNAHLIQARASYTANMPAAQEFYRQMSLTKR